MSSRYFLLVGICFSIVAFANGNVEGLVDVGAGVTETGVVGRVHGGVRIYGKTPYVAPSTDHDSANFLRLNADTPINPTALELTVQMGQPILRIRGTARVFPIRIATMVSTVDGKLSSDYIGAGANVLTYQIIPLTAEGQYTVASDLAMGNSHVAISSELLNFAYTHMSMGAIGRFGSAVLMTAELEAKAAPALAYIKDQDASALYVGAKVGAEGLIEITLPEYRLSFAATASYNYYPTFQKNIDAQHVARGGLTAQFKAADSLRVFVGGDAEYDQRNLRTYDSEGGVVDNGKGESVYFGGKAGIQF